MSYADVVFLLRAILNLKDFTKAQFVKTQTALVQLEEQLAPLEANLCSLSEKLDRKLEDEKNTIVPKELKVCTNFISLFPEQNSS